MRSTVEKTTVCKMKKQYSMALEAIRSTACNTFHRPIASERSFSTATSWQNLSTIRASALQRNTEQKVSPISRHVDTANADKCNTSQAPSIPEYAAVAAPLPTIRTITAI